MALWAEGGGGYPPCSNTSVARNIRRLDERQPATENCARGVSPTSSRTSAPAFAPLRTGSTGTHRSALSGPIINSRSSTARSCVLGRVVVGLKAAIVDLVSEGLIVRLEGGGCGSGDGGGGSGANVGQLVAARRGDMPSRAVGSESASGPVFEPQDPTHLLIPAVRHDLWRSCDLS